MSRFDNLDKRKIELFKKKPPVLDTITFRDSIDNYLPVYYHFLDGYINKNVGYLPDKIYNFIKNNYKNFTDDNLSILEISYVKDFVYFVFTHLPSNKLYAYKVFLDGTDIIIKYDDEDGDDDKDVTIEDLKFLLNYCILQVSNDKHSTSLLFFNKDDNFNILSFNSGAGIDNHLKYNNLFEPYVGVTLGEYNLENFKKVISFILISKIYSIFDSKNDISYDYLYKYIKRYKNICPHINLFDSGFDSVFYDSFTLDQIDIFPIETDFLKNRIISLKKISKHKDYDYYDIIIKKLRNPYYKEFIFNQSFRFNYDEFNFNKNIKFKLILNENETFDKLYIRSQESGSCSWFSVYWPIIFYNIFNNNLTKYYRTVKNIYNYFIKILYKIFTPENFTIAYNNLDFNYMKILCKKFIKLDFLNPDILEQEIDFIYKLNFNLQFNIDTKKTSFVDLNIKSLLDLGNIFDLLTNINDGIKSNLGYTNTCIAFYDLYRYYNDKKRDLFSSSMPMIDINSTISLINNEFSNYKINNYLYEKKNDIDDINNFVEQFNKTYNDSILNPSYIYNYIHWAIHINNYYKFDRKIYDINFDDETVLLNFLKFCHRLNLLLLINDSINKIISRIGSYYLMIKFVGKKEDQIEASKNININDVYSYFFKNILLKLINNNIHFVNLEFTSKQIYIFKLDIFNINIKYIDHIIKTNNKITKTVECESSGEYSCFAPVFKNDFTDIIKCYSIFDTYSRTIRYYKELIIFLFNNPKYIYEDFNNNKFNINSNSFIKLNIYEILKEENIIYRNKLINFYATLYKNNINNDYIISCLQLLLTSKCGLSNKSDINIFLYNNSDLSLEDFSILLNNIYIKEKDNFNNYLISQKENIYIENLDLFTKYISDKKYTIDYINQSITVDNKKYRLINITNCLLKSLFISLTNTKYLLNDNIKEYVHIIIYNNDNIIELFGDSTNEYNFKIKNIIFNNSNIIKFNDIIYPFKYVIPTNCFHLIHLDKKNGIFQVIYFVSRYDDENNYNLIKSENTKNLLGDNDIEENMYTITINNNNQMYPNLEFSDIFIEISKYYDVNNYNIIFLNDIYEDQSRFFLNDNYYYLLNFKKSIFFKEPLSNICYPKINFLNENKSKPDINIKYNINDYLKNQNKIYSKSINNFLFKVSTIEINLANKENILKIIHDKIIKYKKLVSIFTNIVKNSDLSYLFDNYIILYNYLINIKIINTYIILYRYIKSNQYELFNSRIKIFNQEYNLKEKYFVYKYEALFELINGTELYDEQMERYISIIDEFNIFNNKPNKYHLNKPNKDYCEDINMIEYSQVGGSSYPLHHFMMGKGKSAIITPILSLYFILNCSKKIIIIVPDHMVHSTNDIIQNYKFIFNLKKYKFDNDDTEYKKLRKQGLTIKIIDYYKSIIDDHNIMIISDTKIKELFLLGLFSNRDNNDIVMLIDEFDYILDPIKSNLNITNIKDIEINHIIDILIPTGNIDENISFIENGKINESKVVDDNVIILINNEIRNTLSQIHNKTLKENIKWGIHPKLLYAIPFLYKDKPLESSFFSSCILTIYLTLYYYIGIHKYRITDVLLNYIIKNNIIKEFFLYDDDTILTIDIVENFIKDVRVDFFNFIFKKIFKNIKLSKDQLNTSFVDIINMDNIFKIGYSGTININLPPLKSKYIFEHIEPDYDEKINIEYAILNSKIIHYKYIDNNNFFRDIKLEIYNAIIDVCGLFKNYKNIDFVNSIDHYFKSKGINKNIIFINENGDKKVLMNNQLMIYNKYTNYDTPFIYYSQADTIGIDIKQEKYPIMNGLCIIDETLQYSQVAQGMFRLRKLNMGHIITFLYLGDEICPENFLDLIIENENKIKDEKYKYLIFQTIKSEIRKITGVYSEDIKYYMNGVYDDIEGILENIISENDIIKYNLKDLFEKIKDIKILKQLVYNINSNCIEQNREKVEEKEDEDEDENEKEKLSEINKTKQFIDPNMELFFYDYINYDFSNFSNNELFNENTLKLNNNIRFLPNIFVQSTIYNYTYNHSGILFVYFHNFNQILIIPGYLITYFINDYAIINHKLLLINNNCNKLFNKEAIQKIFDDCDLIKVLNCINISDQTSLTSYIAYLIISYSSLSTNRKLNIEEVNLITYYNSENSNENKMNHTYFLNRIFNNKIFNINLIKYFNDKTIFIDNIFDYHTKILINKININEFIIGYFIKIKQEQLNKIDFIKKQITHKQELFYNKFDKELSSEIQKLKDQKRMIENEIAKIEINIDKFNKNKLITQKKIMDLTTSKTENNRLNKLIYKN